MSSKVWLRRNFPHIYSFLRSLKLNSKRIVLDRQIQLVSLPMGVYVAEKLAMKLPQHYDCVIGVPRNGLLFANIIASKLGLPLSTPENFLRNEIWQSKKVEKPSFYNRVLLLEDSYALTSTQLTIVTQQIKRQFPNLEIETASVFINPDATGTVDYYGIIKQPHNIFEWNLLTACGVFGSLCMDLDGVLCKNSNPQQPYLIPKFPIQAIITARFENERLETEKWLVAQGLKYERLLMRSDNSVSNIDFKVQWLKKLKPFWFWESEHGEALTIHKKTKLPVLDVETMTILDSAWKIRSTKKDWR